MKAPQLRPGQRIEVPLGPWVDGIDEKTEAGLLANNQLRAAVNVLLDEVPGKVIKRFGNKEITTLASGLPPKFAYSFKKTDGSEYLMLSDGITLYVTTDLVTITQLVTSLDSDGYLQFETAEDKCWIFNGYDDVMWYDGTSLVIMDSAHTKTGTTGAGTDQTHIVDTGRTEAASDYWKNYVVVITSGALAGMEGRCTAFDPATDKLTISGFTADPSSGVTYSIGVTMPKARVGRYNGTTLFLGGTTENRSEVRFNRLDDPDNGLQMSLDSPRAWPDSRYQLSITQDDGDQIWTFSPNYRNRVLVTKGTAIYRLEPDATYIYVPVLVSREIGCRYPDCWAAKDELLYFVGNERSGLLDLYVTDMVSVRPRHKDGRLLPSFDNMLRAEPSYKYISRASAAQFETGERSTTSKVSGGKIECREITSDTDWNEILTLGAYGTNGDSPTGGVNILGIPPWTHKYDADVLPAAHVEPWTVTNPGTIAEAVVDGGGTEGNVLQLSKAIQSFNVFQYYMQRNSVFDSTKDSMMAFRFRMPRNGYVGSTARFTLANGKYKAELKFVTYSTGGVATYWCYYTYYDQDGTEHNTLIFNYSTDDFGYKTYHILMKATGAFQMFQDGLEIYSGTAALSTDNYAKLLVSYDFANWPGNVGYLFLNFFYYQTQIGQASLINVINTSGTVTLKFDYTRTPHAFGKFWLTLGHDYAGTTATGTDATHIVDNSIAGPDDTWNGRTIEITSGAKIGEQATITDYETATHKFTVSGLSGTPGVGVTYKIIKKGTVAIQTQSSANDSSYSSLQSMTNGQAPAVDNSTPLARYLKIKLTLTRADVVNGPHVEKIIGGELWRMGAVQVGPNISAWRKWLDETTIPAGAAITKKIRLAKTLTTPAEGDFAAWVDITNGNNVGTILSDVIPAGGIPAGEGRWVDALIEMSPTAAGVTPGLENFLINWQEGQNTQLVISALIYKKRMYVTSISRTSAHNDQLFVLDTNNAWTKTAGLSLYRQVAFRGIIYGFSSVDAKIYQQEVEGQYSDGTTPVEAYVDTGAIDFGMVPVEVQNIKIGVSEAQVIGVSLSTDGVTFTSQGTITFTGEDVYNMRIAKGWIGRRHFVRLTSSAAEAMGIVLLKIGVQARAEK